MGSLKGEVLGKKSIQEKNKRTPEDLEMKMNRYFSSFEIF